MATKTELEKELQEMKAKLSKFEAAEGQEPENMTVLPEGEYVPKAEFEKLEAQMKNLSSEHEELVLKYEASPDLSKKVEKAVELFNEGKIKGKALLFKKMSLALGEVRRIPKNGFNSFFQYKYSQEGDILDGIRPILSEVGLMIWTSVEQDERKVLDYYRKGKHEGQKTITRVNVNFIVGCSDSGETLESSYIGEGEDEADKGLYKAYTGATKYFLTKNFLISSGDILQDDAPNDPEADTQRAYDNRQNPYNNPKQRQKQEKNEQARKDYEAEQQAAEALKNEAKELWVKLAGSDEGFEGFYKKQTSKGVNHGQILDFLNNKIAEKTAEASEQPQDAPPQSSEGESQPEPLEPVNTANINPDDMTPEQYVQYVEENLPFPLTPQEREQIMNDAREGNRNHRR